MDVYTNRINVYNETKNISNKYFNCVSESIKHNNTQNFKNVKRYPTTNVQVLHIDTINATLESNNIVLNMANPVVLNMANPDWPGGGVDHGDPAQEENLFRRSNYFLTLRPENRLYKIENNEAIYSPDVTVFRSSEDTNYKLVEPRKISFIASASIRNPDLTPDEQNFKNQSDRDIQKEKIRLIFKIANHYGHDTLILSAFGCGAFRCPSKEVSKIFREVLNEYDGYFNQVIFAILGPQINIVNFRKNIMGV